MIKLALFSLSSLNEWFSSTVGCNTSWSLKALEVVDCCWDFEWSFGYWVIFWILIVYMLGSLGCFSVYCFWMLLLCIKACRLFLLPCIHYVIFFPFLLLRSPFLYSISLVLPVELAFSNFLFWWCFLANFLLCSLTLALLYILV